MTIDPEGLLGAIIVLGVAAMLVAFFVSADDSNTKCADRGGVWVQHICIKCEIIDLGKS